jgi:hypothetical protein
MVKNIYWSSNKVPFILVRFQWNACFLDRVSENLKYQISWESAQWEPSWSTRTDGKTDMKLIVAFPNFANAPKNGDQKHLTGFPI